MAQREITSPLRWPCLQTRMSAGKRKQSAFRNDVVASRLASVALPRGTSINANKRHIGCTTRASGHGRSRKRASRRATPDRAGGRPYHGGSLLRHRKTPQSQRPSLAAKKACFQTRKNVRNRIDIGSAAVTVPVGWFSQYQSAVPTQKRRP